MSYLLNEPIISNLFITAPSTSPKKLPVYKGKHTNTGSVKIHYNFKWHVLLRDGRRFDSDLMKL